MTKIPIRNEVANLVFGPFTRQRTKEFVGEYYGPVLLTAVVLATSGLMHLLWYYSPLQLSEDIWVKKLEFHLHRYPYCTRCMQNYATLLVHQYLSLPIRESFMVVQGVLTMILGPLFYRYLRLLRLSKMWSHVGLFLLMTAYPILGAHFAPTYTWDDIWMYVFGVLCFTALARREPIKAGIYFTLGCFARDQMLLFMPILGLSLWWLRGQCSAKRLLASLVLPAALYLPYRVLVSQAEDPKRWKLLLFNFGDIGRSTDTIVSMIVAFGLLWLLCTVGLMILRRRPMLFPERMIFWGTVITVPLMTAATLLFTLARETRMFFPPFVFVIPLSIVALRKVWESVSSRCSPFTLMLIPTAVAVCIVVGVACGEELFPEWDFRRNALLRRQIAGVHVGAAWVILQGWIIFTLQKHISGISRRPKDSLRSGSAIDPRTGGTNGR